MKTSVAVFMAAMLDIFGWRCLCIGRAISVCIKFSLVDSRTGKEVYQKQRARKLQAKSVVKKRSSFI